MTALLGIQVWSGGVYIPYVPPASIYNRTSITIGAFLIDYTASLPGTDFSVTDLYACDDLSDNAGVFVDSATNDPLYAQASATDIASPHGRAIVNDGATKYWLANPGAPNDEFVTSTSAFAFTTRVKFTGATPGSTTFFLSKGTGAGSNYGFGVDSSGEAVFQCRGPAMAPVVVSSGVNVMDGNYHWIAGGRSITDSKIWISIAGVPVTAAFDNTKDIQPTTREFGVWDAIANAAGMACEVDHMIFWKGTPAENVYSKKASFTFEDN